MSSQAFPSLICKQITQALEYYSYCFNGLYAYSFLIIISITVNFHKKKN